MIDFEILRVIWWLLIGVLLSGFAIFGGFDLGVASLLPYVSRNDTEKRVAINAIAPTWEGNQVWFILGGGAIFAAWPIVYAVAFSNFYYALFLVLVALILRPVGFDFRSKVDSTKWKGLWDAALFISGIVASVVFGVAIGNVMIGIDFNLNNFMFIENKTEFWSMFTPFSLLCGLLSLCMMVTQGACFLVAKTEKTIRNRAIKVLRITPILAILLFCLGGCFIYSMNGYHLVQNMGNDSASNPLAKTVIVQKGAWLINYSKMPLLSLVPITSMIGFFLVWLLTILKRYNFLIIFNSIAIAGIIATVGSSMFPFIIPSKLNNNVSLTVWDASSSQLALFVMLLAVIVFIPIILFYTGWAYKVMFGKVTEKDIKNNNHEFY